MCTEFTEFFPDDAKPTFDEDCFAANFLLNVMFRQENIRRKYYNIETVI